MSAKTDITGTHPNRIYTREAVHGFRTAAIRGVHRLRSQGVGYWLRFGGNHVRPGGSPDEALAERLAAQIAKRFRDNLMIILVDNVSRIRSLDHAHMMALVTQDPGHPMHLGHMCVS